MIVVETRIERQPQHIFAEPHRFCPEDARIHLTRMTHDRFEIHPVEDVALDVDARSNLDQLEPLFREPKYAALGDVEDFLVILRSKRARECTMFDFLDELLRPTIPLNQQLAVHYRDFEVSGRERAEKIYLLRILADVDETAGTGETRSEFRHVEVSLLVGLRQSKKCSVKAPAVVEVELVRHVDDCLRIGGGPEIRAARRDPTD